MAEQPLLNSTNAADQGCNLFADIKGVTIRAPLILVVITMCAGHTHAQTQAAMNAEARAEFEQADVELNKTYEALLRKLPDAEGKERLKQSQRAWLAFRDAGAAFASDQARRGSMAPTIRYETITELTQQRIKQLKVHVEE